MNNLEVGVAVGIVGASVFSIHQVYTQHAGTLTATRTAPPGDPGTAQKLGDADILTGALVVLVGGGLAYMTGKPHALLFALAAFGIIALYYHGASKQVGVAPVNADAPSPTFGQGITSDYTPTDSGSTDYTYDGQ